MKHIASRFHSSTTRQLLTSNRLSDVLEYWTNMLESRRIPEPDTSVELIVAHVLGHKTLYNVGRDKVLKKSQLSDINHLCQLRLKRMPVQYVIEEWDFHDLTLKMRPPVLIPRPETEELANLCIHTLRDNVEKQDGKFLEIGSGSGALSVTLLKKFTKIHALAVDISPAACKLTLENAQLYGVEERLAMIEGDILDDTVAHQIHRLGPFVLIVSNPPYLTANEMKDLQPEIHSYEDHRALDGGSDGMNLIKHIILKAPHLLQKDGHVWLEVAPQHPAMVAEIVKTKEPGEALRLVDTVTDAFGKNRFCHLLKTQHKNTVENLSLLCLQQ